MQGERDNKSQDIEAIVPGNWLRFYWGGIAGVSESFPHFVLPTEDSFGVTPIRTSSELEFALSTPRAMVFLWVNWAVHAFSSRSIVARVLQAWRTVNSNPSVPCFEINVSDQCGEVWDSLTAWLSKEARPNQILFAGSGSFLWIESGRVLAHVLNPNSFGESKLYRATCSIWPSDFD